MAIVEKGEEIPDWGQEKLASRWVSSITYWIAGKLEQTRGFPRNKSKIKWKSSIEIFPSEITERKFKR